MVKSFKLETVKYDNVSFTPVNFTQRTALYNYGSQPFPFSYSVVQKDGKIYVYQIAYSMFAEEIPDGRMFTHKLLADSYDKCEAIVCVKTGNKFDFNRANMSTTFISQTVPVYAGYSIQQWVFGLDQIGADYYGVIVFGASNGSSHYYEIVQCTTSGVTSLYKSNPLTGGNVNPVAAPLFYKKSGAWVFEILLSEYTIFKHFTVQLKASPTCTLISSPVFGTAGKYRLSSYSALYTYNKKFYVTLKNTIDSSYKYFVFDAQGNSSFIYSGLIVYPPFEMNHVFPFILSLDITNKRYVYLTKKYPGVHPIFKDDLIFDCITAFSVEIISTIKNGAEYNTGVGLKRLNLVSGTMTDKDCKLTFATAIETFPKQHLLLYDDSNELIGYFFVKNESYTNGLQQLDCINLNTEIDSLSTPAVYDNESLADIVEDQLTTARYCYPGTLEGGNTSISIQEGYTLQQLLFDLGQIFGGIGYVALDGAVNFRTTNFETGPTLNRTNANYIPGELNEILSNYGKIEVYGAFVNGKQLYAEVFDQKVDQSMILQIEVSTIQDQTVLQQIADNILAWQQNGIYRLRLNYFFGYLRRGQKLTVNLSGWAIKFGKTEPLSNVDMYVLSSKYNLVTNQSEVEVCTIPYFAQKSRAAVDIIQQQQNLQRQIGFSAFGAYKNTETAIPHSTEFKLIYDKKSYDLNGDYNAITGRFTAPYNGIYHFNASYLTTWDNWQAGDTYRLVFHKNGVQYYRANWNTIQANISQNMASFGAMDVYLDVGDYIEVIATFSRVNRSIFAGAGDNLFEGHLVRRID